MALVFQTLGPINILHRYWEKKATTTFLHQRPSEEHPEIQHCCILQHFYKRELPIAENCPQFLILMDKITSSHTGLIGHRLNIIPYFENMYLNQTAVSYFIFNVLVEFFIVIIVAFIVIVIAILFCTTRRLRRRTRCTDIRNWNLSVEFYKTIQSTQR